MAKNIFERATRQKLSFATTVGVLHTQDLWDLTLPALNKLAVSLNKQIKEAAEEDFLSETAGADAQTKLGFDVVIHILNTKKQEKVARHAAAANKETKDKLLGALARKQDAALEDMSAEDLQKAVDAL